MNESIYYEETVPWIEEQQLQGEKETLGLYFSGHPIRRYQKELANFLSCKLSDLSIHKEAIVAGVITQIRARQTKRGDRMAIVTLDDSTAQNDVLCFSDVYQKYRHLLTKDQLIVVSGEISVDEFSDGYRIFAQALYSVDEAREHFAKYLQIIFRDKKEDPEQLAQILSPYRGGTCAVMVRYLHKNATADIQLGESWRIRPVKELLNLLRRSFPEDQVEIVY